MALIVLASASGSPGVSTTALGLTLNWHASRAPGRRRPDRILLGLRRLLPRHPGADRRPDQPRPLLARGSTGRCPAPRDAAAGPGSPGRAIGLVPARHPLPRAGPQPAAAVGAARPSSCAALERNGQDVIVDAGRLGLVGWPQPLIAASDLTLLVTRSSLPALAGADQLGQDPARTSSPRSVASLGSGSSSSMRSAAGQRCPPAPASGPTPPATSPRPSRSPWSPPWTGNPRWPRSTPTAPASPASSSPPACCAATGPSTAAIQSILGANQAALAPTNGGQRVSTNGHQPGDHRP